MWHHSRSHAFFAPRSWDPDEQQCSERLLDGVHVASLRLVCLVQAQSDAARTGEGSTARLRSRGIDVHGGYSGTPLVRKLGFRPGMRAHFVSAPGGFAALVGDLPDGVRVLARPAPDLDLAVLFVVERRELERRLPGLHDKLAPAGMVWVAWPKRASRVPTDLTEDVVREVALARGLVDVKVCAIDETWSGLKLVIRRELR